MENLESLMAVCVTNLVNLEVLLTLQAFLSAFITNGLNRTFFFQIFSVDI